MKHIRAIIIEDEPLVARDLQKLVKAIAPDLEVLAVIDSLKAGVAYFKSNPPPDLLFMDIQLNDGVSFDLLSRVKITCPIIFTTAYDEYAVRAFKLNSIDYLLKPIDREELQAALEKFKRLQDQQRPDLTSPLQTLAAQLMQPTTAIQYKQRFMVHQGKSYVVVEGSQVACFQKDTLIYLVTKDSQRHITDFETMEELEELLDPREYFRANRQVILRLESIGQFHTDVYGKLKVKLRQPAEMEVDISREKAQAFKKWLG